jgi:hypothetical protein
MIMHIEPNNEIYLTIDNQASQQTYVQEQTNPQ